MAGGVNIEIEGADALIGFLGGLSDQVADIVSEEIEAGVQSIREDAVKLAPVDTGRLRSSIQAEASGLNGEVKTNVEYAGYMEFGTGGNVDVKPGWEEIAEKYRGKGERTVNIAPRPFMRPALEKNAPEIMNQINDRIGKELG